MKFNVGDKLQHSADPRVGTLMGQRLCTVTGEMCVWVEYDDGDIKADYESRWVYVPFLTQANYYNYLPASQTGGLGLKAPYSTPILIQYGLPTCETSGHRWTQYTGLTEAYDFCDVKGCDKKRPLGGKY